MMNDFSAGVENRNYKIAHRADSRNLAELLASMLCILMIAGALTGYVYTRCRIVALGYEVQKCKDLEQTLARKVSFLILEEEYLKNPERIDRIARTELAMEPVGPYQRLTPAFSETSARPATLALVNTPAAGAAPRRPSANN